MCQMDSQCTAQVFFSLYLPVWKYQLSDTSSSFTDQFYKSEGNMIASCIPDLDVPDKIIFKRIRVKSKTMKILEKTVL